MRVIKRRNGERIRLLCGGTEIYLTVVHVDGKGRSVAIGFDAPGKVDIARIDPAGHAEVGAAPFVSDERKDQ